MAPTGSDAVFAGSIPEFYDTHLVPLIFEPCSAEMARRVVALAPARVLETACGTGVLTRALARSLPASAELVATDLNPPMLVRAQAVGTQGRPVSWQAADALQLPFEDGAFDVVVCQFGVMFFPDKAAAFAEARRVLRRNGSLLFAVWDRIEENEFAALVTDALALRYPADPPRFIVRTPHGYFERETISGDLGAAGFSAEPRFETLSAHSRAASAALAAIAYCQGTPLRNEIEARAPGDLGGATAACAQALAARFGSGAIEGRIQALAVSLTR